MESMGSIIVVEDEFGNRTLMEKLLTSKGYRVEPFANAEDAIERMDRGNSISLVIIDVMLPGMDGLELSDWVNKNHPGVPMMFVTGDPNQVTKPGYIVMAKPLNNADFLNHVWQHVKLGQMTMGFRELKSDFSACIDKVSEVSEDVKAVNNNLTAYTREAADARTKQDAMIVSTASKAEAALRAAEAAGTQANNANTNATNAHVKVDSITLGTTVKNWKDKLDPVSLVVMTVLTGIICWFTASYKDDLIEKAIPVDKKIKVACEPMQADIKKTNDKVDSVDRGQAIINVKIEGLDKGQSNLDRKIDRLLWRLNVPPSDPPPVMSSPKPRTP